MTSAEGEDLVRVGFLDEVLESNRREPGVEQPTEVELDIAPVVDLDPILEPVDERPVLTLVRIERQDEITPLARSRDQEANDNPRGNPRASHASPFWSQALASGSDLPAPLFRRPWRGATCVEW